MKKGMKGVGQGPGESLGDRQTKGGGGGGIGYKQNHEHNYCA